VIEVLRSIGLLSTFLLAAAAAFAQAADPPSRVARLNYETGPVSFRPGSVDDWSAATPNYPLTTGDHLWADQGAQAEMHVGSTAIRMSANTALSFLNLDDRTLQLSLTAGSIRVHLRNLRDDEVFEVDTPNVAVSLLRPGDYRINADGDAATSFISVYSGEAELTGGGNAFPVHPRQAARITGTDQIAWDLIDVPPPDAFDRWSESRDLHEEQAASLRYVPREMIGYEDLDANGVWRDVPPYGWVWTPTRMVAGWAPYRYGHWAWVAPWGWTWVDDAPWGFAPLHYGRWAFAPGGWVWVPGRIVERPVYAPALVAFVGGPRFSVSIGVGGGGGVAWFPLGPGEVYRPAYHVSETYVRNVNITHVNVTNINVTNVNVTNVRYVNQNVQGAVTVVPQQAFVSARPVAREAVVVTPQQTAQMQVVGHTAVVAPRPESIVARPVGAVAVARPPAQILQRTVVAKAPPPPPPVSFRAQQQALQTNQGRPLDPNALNTLRTAQPPAPQVRVRTAQQVAVPAQAPPVPRPQQPFGTPRSEHPPSVTGQPPARPEQPQVAPKPVPNDRPLRQESRPEQPQAAPRPVPNDRPQRQEPRPEQPQVAPRPVPNDRPAIRPEQRPAAPAAAPPPERRPAAAAPPPERRPAPEERKADKKDERRDKREEHKEQ
jgi:hypothetical protein